MVTFAAPGPQKVVDAKLLWIRSWEILGKCTLVSPASHCIGARGLCLLLTLKNFLGCPFDKELLFLVDILSYIILVWRSVILVTYSLVPALFGADLA